MRSCKVVIDASTYICWALLILILPLRWVAAFFLASTVHECFHYAALCACHSPVLQLRIGIGGIQMEIPELGYFQELMCALAGPVGELLLAFFYKSFPELAVCAIIQSAYNFLPVYPLDGGRALRCAANLIFPHCADAVCKWVERLVFAGIVLVGIRLKWSILAICAGCFLAIKLLSGKIPCKPSFLRVQ